MTVVSINKQARLSDHFTLGELTKTNTKIKNVPNEAQVENLKRLCGWLEQLRRRPTPSPSLLREGSEEPIIINSGYRSPEVNRAVGGVATSNHLTGCAVDMLERSPKGTYWLHFAVRPSGNRRKIRLIQT